VLTDEAVSWVAHQSWFKTTLRNVLKAPNGSFSTLLVWGNDLYQRYDECLEAFTYVVQTFVICLALILFSLPIFAVAALVGSVDGLV